MYLDRVVFVVMLVSGIVFSGLAWSVPAVSFSIRAQIM